MQGSGQGLWAGVAALVGDDMGGHEGIACAGDPCDHDGRRGIGDHASALGAFSAGAAAIGDKNAGSPTRQQGRGGIGGAVKTGFAEQSGLFQIYVKRGARMREQGQQAFGLAGAGRGHPQIGAGKQRRGGNFRQQRHGQIAVKGNQTLPRRIGAAQTTVGHGAQDLVARSLQRMRVGNRGDQAVCAFDRHITVGRQVFRAIEVVGDQPHALTGGDQFFALGVTPDGGQQRRGHAKTRQRHGDIHRHTTGQAGDPPRHVRAKPHRNRRATDNVP